MCIYARGYPLQHVPISPLVLQIVQELFGDPAQAGHGRCIFLEPANCQRTCAGAWWYDNYNQHETN